MCVCAYCARAHACVRGCVYERVGSLLARDASPCRRGEVVRGSREGEGKGVEARVGAEPSCLNNGLVREAERMRVTEWWCDVCSHLLTRQWMWCATRKRKGVTVWCDVVWCGFRPPHCRWNRGC